VVGLGNSDSNSAVGSLQNFYEFTFLFADFEYGGKAAKKSTFLAVFLSLFVHFVLFRGNKSAKSALICV